MSIDLEAIRARNTDAQRRRLGLDYRDALQAHMRDIPALLAEVERQTAENKTLSDYIEAYIDICDRHQETHHKLMDKIAAVIAERDAAVNDLRGKCQYCARQPMRRLSDGQLDALCATCQEYNKCNWKYLGARKEQNDGK